MPYDFSPLKQKIRETEDWLRGELTAIRTGRATSAILDTIRIDSYGAKVPVNHVAGISMEDAKTLRVIPWDKTHIKDIEKAVNDADLGLSVSSDSEGLRVSFPDLTSERREMFVKAAKKKTEEARVALRRARDDTWGDIQKKERDGDISEDEKFQFKDDMQKLIDEANTHFGEMEEKKEKEIQG